MVARWLLGGCQVVAASVSSGEEKEQVRREGVCKRVCVLLLLYTTTETIVRHIHYANTDDELEKH